MKLRWLGTLAVVSILSVQCTKQAPEAMSSEVRLMEQDSPPAIRAKSGPEIEWMLYCEGECAECQGTGVKLAPRVYECQCEENCSLKIMRVGDQPGLGTAPENYEAAKRSIDSLTNIYGTFAEQLKSTLQTRYQLDSYRVSAVEVYASGGSFACKYYVDAPEQETGISIVYVVEDVGVPGYEVDCNGGCVKASARCTEIMKLGSPIQIECGCEGECKMDIIAVEEPQE